jgi:hypothetical protein
MFTHATQCMKDVLDPPVSAFSLSLYRHPFLYTLFSSRFTFIINNNKKVADISILGIGRTFTPRNNNFLPSQLAHDPDSWTAAHLLQLKMEYEVLVNNYGCKVQIYTVQDYPPPPSEFLLLPPLDSLYKVYMRNQELPQPEDSRPVMPPSQRALSQQMMKSWIPWETNIRKSNNSRMLQQLVFHTQQIIKTTSTQDLDPLPLANNDHASVLPFEMYSLDPGEPPSRTLNWKP